MDHGVNCTNKFSETRRLSQLVQLLYPEQFFNINTKFDNQIIFKIMEDLNEYRALFNCVVAVTKSWICNNESLEMQL